MHESVSARRFTGKTSFSDSWYVRRFEAKQAKFLRVSVSSFYDYLTVALKCFQEFDPDMHSEIS
jgi:hypothetical protein